VPPKARSSSVASDTVLEREERRAAARDSSELKIKSVSGTPRMKKTQRATANNGRPALQAKVLRDQRNGSHGLANASRAGGARRSKAAKRASELAMLGARPRVLSTLLEGIEEGVAHVSTEGVILYANERFAQLLGAHPADMVEGQARLRDFLSAECWTELDEGLKLAAREPVEGSLRVEDVPDRTVRMIRLALRPVRWKKATTIGVTAAEMTQLMEKNRELQEKESSLHALSARILQLQDEERRRIARDLHDITGQELAVVIMQLMQVAKQQRMDAEAEKGIADAASLVKKIEDEIRTLSYVLHPPLLDELGLCAALNWYADGFTKRSSIEVRVEVAQDLPRLTNEKEMALFRVVQEALTNVLRHSGSRKALIRVTFDHEAVVLTVEDEGKGIGRRRLGKAAQEHGVGIAGMRERLQQLGGGLEMRPLPKGTQVSARVPIRRAEPIERPLTEAELLKVAMALGHKEEPGATVRTRASAGEANTSATASGASVAKKRVLIADDHEVTRQGIRSLLRDEQDIEICGEAKDGPDAVAKAKQLNPDLIIMDLTMPGGGGFSAANQIRSSGSPAKILLFTTHSSSQLEGLSRMAGFDGIVHKTDGARDLVCGVRAVLGGNKFFRAEAAKASAARA
jgi:signal transduction histidine kinase